MCKILHISSGFQEGIVAGSLVSAFRVGEGPVGSKGDLVEEEKRQASQAFAKMRLSTIFMGDVSNSPTRSMKRRVRSSVGATWKNRS